MKSRIAGFGLLVVSTLFATSAAMAGTKRSATVTIDNINRTATGSLSAVRATADSNQTIGCVIISETTTVSANCLARDAAGNTRNCVTSQANHLQAIATLQGDSQLIFSWNTQGACTRIAITNDSTFAPKAP